MRFRFACTGCKQTRNTTDYFNPLFPRNIWDSYSIFCSETCFEVWLKGELLPFLQKRIAEDIQNGHPVQERIMYFESVRKHYEGLQEERDSGFVVSDEADLDTIADRYAVVDRAEMQMEEMDSQLRGHIYEGKVTRLLDTKDEDFDSDDLVNSQEESESEGESEEDDPQESFFDVEAGDEWDEEELMAEEKESEQIGEDEDSNISSNHDDDSPKPKSKKQRGKVFPNQQKGIQSSLFETFKPKKNNKAVTFVGQLEGRTARSYRDQEKNKRKLILDELENKKRLKKEHKKSVKFLEEVPKKQRKHKTEENENHLTNNEVLTFKSRTSADFCRKQMKSSLPTSLSFQSTEDSRETLITLFPGLQHLSVIWEIEDMRQRLLLCHEKLDEEEELYFSETEELESYPLSSDYLYF